MGLFLFLGREGGIGPGNGNESRPGIQIFDPGRRGTLPKGREQHGWPRANQGGAGAGRGKAYYNLFSQPKLVPHFL